MPVVPKFQTYECGERVPTQFQVKGGEVEYPEIVARHAAARSERRIATKAP
jgi:hypothetical protein